MNSGHFHVASCDRHSENVRDKDKSVEENMVGIQENVSRRYLREELCRILTLDYYFSILGKIVLILLAAYGFWQLWKQ